jgi:hypothetical protein
VGVAVGTTVGVGILVGTGVGITDVRGEERPRSR